jgi:hypothetical protein
MRNTTSTTATVIVRNFTLAASLVAILATTTPLAARERARDGAAPRDGESPIVRTVKRVVKKVFGITILETPTLPLPR